MVIKVEILKHYILVNKGKYRTKCLHGKHRYHIREFTVQAGREGGRVNIIIIKVRCER